VWIAEGWYYLAILVDLCTRAIVGWALGEHCDTSLALRALEAALAPPACYRPAASQRPRLDVHGR
jgi:transposase InsO family protein